MIPNINAIKFSWILITFEGKYHQENAKNGIFERLEAHAFSASQLPRFSETSGYGPAHGPFWRADFLFRVSW